MFVPTRSKKSVRCLNRWLNPKKKNAGVHPIFFGFDNAEGRFRTRVYQDHEFGLRSDRGQVALCDFVAILETTIRFFKFVCETLYI